MCKLCADVLSSIELNLYYYRFNIYCNQYSAPSNYVPINTLILQQSTGRSPRDNPLHFFTTQKTGDRMEIKWRIKKKALRIFEFLKEKALINEISVDCLNEEEEEKEEKNKEWNKFSMKIWYHSAQWWHLLPSQFLFFGDRRPTLQKIYSPSRISPSFIHYFSFHDAYRKKLLINDDLMTLIKN